MKYTLEICVSSMLSVLAARDGGANRIELCDNLGEGGTTPSYGMIKTCQSLLNIPVFPIIRPRGGDFVYSDIEFEVMKQDISACLALDCKGVVFGILTADGAIDVKRCAELISVAGSMALTFHRAFDRCSDLNKGLEDIIALGFHRVLTSGGREYAVDAMPELQSLVKQAKGRIIIMPGSGINEENLSEIAAASGAVEFHSTAKGKMDFSTRQNNLDAPYLYETDVQKVRRLRDILNCLPDRSV